MAENRDAGVDPRFDPVFQRGYDPAVHGERRHRPAARHATAPAPGPVPGPLPVESATESRPVRELPDAASRPAADAVAQAPESDTAFHARNPFRLALLVTSIVAIAAAGLMVWYRVGEEAYYGGFSGTEVGLLFRSQLVATLPVPLLTGGILGVILWLAIGALAYRSRVDDDVD